MSARFEDPTQQECIMVFWQIFKKAWARERRLRSIFWHYFLFGKYQVESSLNIHTTSDSSDAQTKSSLEACLIGLSGEYRIESSLEMH